jgi:hypothetical protein
MMTQVMVCYWDHMLALRAIPNKRREIWSRTGKDCTTASKNHVKLNSQSVLVFRE